jgi:hypothetical protein
MRPVEGETVVNHQCDKAKFARRNTRVGEPITKLSAEEDGLAAISICYPTVKDEDGAELIGVSDL